MKISTNLQVIVEFDKDIFPSDYGELLKSYLTRNLRNTEFIFGFGSTPDVLVIKDKISDK